MTTIQKTYCGYRDGYRTSEPLFVLVQEGDGEGRPLPGAFPPGTWDRGASIITRKLDTCDHGLLPSEQGRRDAHGVHEQPTGRSHHLVRQKS
jgi:hypothetical protein